MLATSSVGRDCRLVVCDRHTLTPRCPRCVNDRFLTCRCGQLGGVHLVSLVFRICIKVPSPHAWVLRENGPIRKLPCAPLGNCTAGPISKLPTRARPNAPLTLQFYSLHSRRPLLRKPATPALHSLSPCHPVASSSLSLRSHAARANPPPPWLLHGSHTSLASSTILERENECEAGREQVRGRT